MRSLYADWARGDFGSAEWADPEIDELHDVGDKVLAILHQRGRSKRSGMLVVGSMGHLWTLRDGKGTRMDVYSDPREAVSAVGLEG